jgi:hypothetical protein
LGKARQSWLSPRARSLALAASLPISRAAERLLRRFHFPTIKNNEKMSQITSF